jgi:hypothetical protein
MLTALPAAAAGVVLPRESADGGPTPTVRRFVVLLGQALRDPVAVVLSVVVPAVWALDVLALPGGLPGASVLGPVIGPALAGVVLVLLRTAARWSPGDRWAVSPAEPSRGRVGYPCLVVAPVFAVERR